MLSLRWVRSLRWGCGNTIKSCRSSILTHPRCDLSDGCAAESKYNGPYRGNGAAYMHPGAISPMGAIPGLVRINMALGLVVGPKRVCLRRVAIGRRTMLRSVVFAETSRTLWVCCSLYVEALDFLCCTRYWNIVPRAGSVICDVYR